MSRILVLQHVAAEPLGTLDALIRKRGQRVRLVNFERDPAARPRLERYCGLIVLGGPMNVADRAQRAHLQVEIDLIAAAVAANKPVLGICLGAQLLAYALGAPVRKHVCSEIGWYDVDLTPHGVTDPVIAQLGPSHPVFEWHGYTFDLPVGAMHLARSATCENQAFRFGKNAYGFQFHLEMDRTLIERWLALPSYLRDLKSAGVAHDADAIRAQTVRHIDAMKHSAHTVFNNFLDLIGTSARRRAMQSAD